eukprot:362877-Chlamydomonas_euryale.AAC.7
MYLTKGPRRCMASQGRPAAAARGAWLHMFIGGTPRAETTRRWGLPAVPRWPVRRAGAENSPKCLFEVWCRMPTSHLPASRAASNSIRSLQNYHLHLIARAEDCACGAESREASAYDDESRAWCRRALG